MWPFAEKFGNEKVWECKTFNLERASQNYDKLVPQGLKHRYLNSGVMVGEFGDACDFIQSVSFKKQIMDKDCAEDQGLFAVTFFENSRWVGLDLKSEMIFSGCNSEGNVQYNITNHIPYITIDKDGFKSYPPIIHSNCISGPHFELQNKWKLSKNELRNATLRVDNQTVQFFEICSESHGIFY